MYVVPLLLLSLLSTLQYASSQSMTLTLLTDAATRYGAVCLDGTPPAYYFIQGTGSGANKWFIYHQGGGWCESLIDCYGRSLTVLGSSKTYPATMGVPGGYFSVDPKVNPLAYNWNKVYIMYCDGGSFSGDNDTVQDYEGHKVYYRGFRNLRAYHEDLALKHNFNAGTDYLITGCSAGGLATYLHVDWWAYRTPAGSVVKGMPDSGFFLDYDSTTGPKYATAIQWVFKAMNGTGGVNQECIAAHTPTKDTFKCAFAEHTTPFIRTPIFPLQSVYDSWQIDNILGSKNDADINAYGKLVAQRFRTVVFANPKNGAFLDSCYHHCGEWDSIRIDGTLAGDALQAWYAGQNGVHVQAYGYPCTACCTP